MYAPSDSTWYDLTDLYEGEVGDTRQLLNRLGYFNLIVNDGLYWILSE